MVQCYVPHCKNRSDCQNWKKQLNIPKVTFHRLSILFKIFYCVFFSFPKNSTIRNLWIDILRIDQSISSSARICSAHFKEESLDRTNPSLIRLRPNALPFSSEEKQEEDSFVAYCNIKNYSYLCNIIAIIITFSAQPSTTADKATIVKPCTEEKVTMVSLKRIYNSEKMQIKDNKSSI
nr:PREDICTED: LOW QUALITY PROTEIN: uncharacterized protein LOC105677298 [Linepithema humile]